MKIPRSIYDNRKPFTKKYPWDPDKPEGWTYREGINRNGNRYRGYFPPPSSKDVEPIWMQAYWPYGDPEELARQRAERVRQRVERNRSGWSRNYSSGDPSTGDALSAMFWGAPNM